MSARRLFSIFIFAILALFVYACSDDSRDDETCDSDEDCLTGWGWVCVDHKCVLPDGDADAESADGDGSGIKPCSKIDNKNECLEDTARCKWENNACSPQLEQPDGDYDYDYQDSNPGDNGAGCPYLDYEQCIMWPQCEWLLGICTTAEDNPNDCSKYRTESECARGYGCEWNGYACVAIW